jgi:integrase
VRGQSIAVPPRRRHPGVQTGLRHDEIRLLRWKQVDFTHSAIAVGKANTIHSTGRVVPLNQRALATIREWAQQFPKRKRDHYVFPTERVGFSGNDEIPQVFDTDPTTPITSWKTAWETAKTAAGVTCRFHDLRHTTVTRLLERGAPFATVATIMGWSAGTAMRMAKRYSHIGQSAQREALALLDAKPATTAAESKGGASASPSAATLALDRRPFSDPYLRVRPRRVPCVRSVRVLI